MNEISLSNPIVVGLHIPKCAGTTFAKTCREQFPPHRFYRNSDPVGFHIKRHPEFTTLNFHELRLIFGHFIFEEMLKFLPSSRSVVLFTGLRDPIERSRSEFYFAREFSEQSGQSPPSFEEWLNSPQYQNRMCKWLVIHFPSFIDRDASTLSEQAISILQKFDLVYDTKSFNQDIEIIYRMLGIQAAIKRYNVTDDEKKTPVPEDPIKQINREDLELYEYYLDHSDLMPRDLNALQRRVVVNHELRSSILGYDPDLHTLYQDLFSRKKGVYNFSGMLHEVVRDKINELHSLTFELEDYVRDDDGIALDPDEIDLLSDTSIGIQSLLKQEHIRPRNESNRVHQPRNIEPELRTVRKELNAIYASRGHRFLERLRAIRRRIFSIKK